MKTQVSATTAEAALQLAKRHANRPGLISHLSEKLEEYRRVEHDLQQIVASFAKQIELIDKIEVDSWVLLSRSRQTGHPSGWWQVTRFDADNGIIGTSHPDYNVHVARVEAVSAEMPKD